MKKYKCVFVVVIRKIINDNNVKVLMLMQPEILENKTIGWRTLRKWISSTQTFVEGGLELFEKTFFKIDSDTLGQCSSMRGVYEPQSSIVEYGSFIIGLREGDVTTEVADRIKELGYYWINVENIQLNTIPIPIRHYIEFLQNIIKNQPEALLKESNIPKNKEENKE